MEDNLVLKLTEKITDTIKELARPETAVGKPFKMNDYIVVPAVNVHFGFGTGGSSKETPEKDTTEKDTSGGGGGGVKVEPAAFLIAYGNEVDLLNIAKGKGLEAIFECMPSVVKQTGEAIKGLMGDKKTEKAPEAEE